jgi:SAM-dependent methyltransferase
MSAEFDTYAPTYSELLRDPIRDRFAGDNRFFHERKWELINGFLRSRRIEPSTTRWLDVGCGDGSLLKLAGRHFARAAGCDPSGEMIRSCGGMEIRHQPSSTVLPFAARSFDLVTAVCVYHHVHAAARKLLTDAINRVLTPGGVFCMIEHNPRNPITRLIVSRCPVDRDAELLTAGDAAAVFDASGLEILDTAYFLYFPGPLYAALRGVEHRLRRIALGGQFAVFGRSSQDRP